MFAPLVSIVIPVFNGKNFLSDAIDSALAQTYPRCEIIVVNDGSLDGGETEAIARSYGNRIRYITKSNGGVASALNVGIDLMQGDYLAWLSHDDVYLPTKVESQINFLQSRNLTASDRIFLFSDYNVVNIRKNTLYTFKADSSLIERFPFYAVFKHQINGCTTLISRQLLLDAGGFNDLPTSQDYDLWFRLIRLASPLHLPEVTLLSRHHDAQGFRSDVARLEACKTFIRLLNDLTKDEILSCAHSEQAFFAEIARSFCEIDMRPVHEFAWSRASLVDKYLYKFSSRRLLKLFMYKLGLLSSYRNFRNTILGRP